jgi:hypothetical protein
MCTASETSVNLNVITWHYIPEDTKFHTRHRENLKSHKLHPVPIMTPFLFKVYSNISVTPGHGIQSGLFL